MNVAESYKEIILKEFEYVIKKMDEAKDFEEQLYYFSATFGIVKRVLNLDYDRLLIVIHQTLTQTYTALSARLSSIKANREKPIAITDAMIEQLFSLTYALYDALKQNKDVHPVLDDFNVLTYVTNGNGYYLYTKGEIVFDK